MTYKMTRNGLDFHATKRFVEKVSKNVSSDGRCVIDIRDTPIAQIDDYRFLDEAVEKWLCYDPALDSGSFEMTFTITEEMDDLPEDPARWEYCSCRADGIEFLAKFKQAKRSVRTDGLIEYHTVLTYTSRWDEDYHVESGPDYDGYEGDVCHDLYDPYDRY